MSYEIEVNLPNLPKGAEVVVSGLGAFENGKVSPVPDDQLALYMANNPVPVYDDDGSFVVDEETGEQLFEAPAPTKLNFQEGIKVRRAKAAAAPAEKNEEKDGGS